MTRRGAIIGAMLVAGGKLAAQDKLATTGVAWALPEPTDLHCGFGGKYGFKALVVEFGDGSKVTLTEADLKRELAPSEPQEQS